MTEEEQQDRSNCAEEYLTRESEVLDKLGIPQVYYVHSIEYGGTSHVSHIGIVCLLVLGRELIAAKDPVAFRKNLAIQKQSVSDRIRRSAPGYTRSLKASDDSEDQPSQ